MSGGCRTTGALSPTTAASRRRAGDSRTPEATTGRSGTDRKHATCCGGVVGESSREAKHLRTQPRKSLQYFRMSRRIHHCQNYGVSSSHRFPMDLSIYQYDVTAGTVSIAFGLSSSQFQVPSTNTSAMEGAKFPQKTDIFLYLDANNLQDMLFH